MTADRTERAAGGPTPTGAPPQERDLAWFGAVFAAALFGAVRSMGVSPAIWEDTLIEDKFIDRCLLQDQCSIVGVGATVGINHSAGYLHGRSLLRWLGFEADATHLVLLATTALGVALTALVARRIYGRTAAAIAALVMAGCLGLPTQLQVITDVAPLPFLGAVFLVVALATSTREDLRVTALLGFVGAVVANTYATGLACGVSAVWIALMLPRRRWAHAAVAAASFGLATFAIAPGTWIVDAAVVLSHPVGNGHGVVVHPVFAIQMARLAGLATVIWAAAAVRRSPLRAALDVPAAIIVPILVPLVLGSSIHRLDPQGKYCAHILPAISVGVAVTAVAAFRELASWSAQRWSPPFARVSLTAAVDRFAPYAAALVIAVLGVGWGSDQQFSSPPFTFRDVASVEGALAHDRHWSLSKAARDLKTADGTVMAATLRHASAWPQARDDGALERAYFVKNWSAFRPGSLPANVVRTSSTTSGDGFLAFTCSWIDWSSFRSCVKHPDVAGETCTETGLVPPDEEGITTVPGMPASDASHLAPQTLTLHVPLRPRAECPEQSVYMPRTTRLCPGRIVSIDGVRSQIRAVGSIGDHDDGQRGRRAAHRRDCGGVAARRP